MRLIIDENLPRRLVPWLVARGCTAEHVIDLGLQGATDARVWIAAQDRAAAVLTRDTDFVALVSNAGDGGVIRLGVGNCSIANLIAWLETVWPSIEQRWDAGERVIEQ